MVYYPIVITTLNRHNHFKECVESLKNNKHADKTEIIIALDYPPSEEYVDGYKKTKEYLKTLSGFKRVTVIERDKNFGARKNGRAILEYVMDRYEAFITTEDDNVFSPNFLDYMNKALDKYKDDDSVISVGGYMRPVDFDKKTLATVIKIKGEFMAWGMGRWTRKCREIIECEMPEHMMQYVCDNRNILKKLKNNPSALYNLVVWTINNPSLDCRCDLTYSVWSLLEDKYSIYPLKSLVRNNGYDGSGVNCIEDVYYTHNQDISTENSFGLIEPLQGRDYEDFLDGFVSTTSNVVVRSRRQAIMTRFIYYTYMIFRFKIGTKIVSQVLKLFSSDRF